MDGHDKKPAAETENKEGDGHRRLAAGYQAEKDHAQGHAHRAQRHQADLHPPAGYFTGDNGTGANTQGRNEKQKSALFIGQIKGRHAVRHRIQLDKGAEKHKTGRSKGGDENLFFPADLVKGLPDVAEEKQ